MVSLSEQYQRRQSLLNYSALLTFNRGELKNEPILDSLPEDSKKVIEWWEKVQKVKNEERFMVNQRDVRNYVLNMRIEQVPNPDSRVGLVLTRDTLGLNQLN